MVAEIRAQGLASSTAIIISAKHGQSPTNPDDLTRMPDAPIIGRHQRGLDGGPPGRGQLVDLLHRR